MMDIVFLGKIVNTHGIKGELRISSDFERPNDAFKVGNELLINQASYVITSYRIHKDYHMVTFAGFNNINQVLFLKNQDVYIRRNLLNLKDGEYLYCDLIDLDVYLDDCEIGCCTDFKNGLNKLIEIDNHLYVPYNDEFISRVDIDNNRIYLTSKAKELIS